MKQNEEINKLNVAITSCEKLIEHVSMVVWPKKTKYIDHIYNAINELKKARACMKDF